MMAGMVGLRFRHGRQAVLCAAIGIALATAAPARCQTLDDFRFPSGGATAEDASAPDAPAGDGSTEQLPDLPPRVTIPLSGPAFRDRLQVKSENGLVSLVVRDVPVNQVLAVLAQNHGLNIVAAENVNAPISVTLDKVRLADALTAILSVSGYTWVQQGDIIFVTSLSGASRLPAEIQGRELLVVPLDYVSAADVDLTVKGLLSPIGQSFATQSNPINNRRTQEIIVIEDTPGSLHRIEQYLTQIDQPPRQVLIEAHVLQIRLKDDNRHGINFEKLCSLGGGDVTVEMAGFANPASPQAFFFNFNGDDFDALIEFLETTTDSKTLAKPKVAVMNGQEARMQVGQQLGFRVTTTTETSTLESVEFLDVGVVLTVTPRITRDGQVLMQVRPEVSKGQVNPDTGLPEEETTEVETSIMLPDGRGVVIGGLIQEQDLETASKVPILGDLWLIGRLFQRRQVTRERSEIIIALVPRIVPFDPIYAGKHCEEVDRAAAPLLQGPLCKAPRPWEPRLPDAIERPSCVRLPKVQPWSDPCCGEDEGYYAPQFPLHQPGWNEPAVEVVPTPEAAAIVPQRGPALIARLPKVTDSPVQRY